ncbi:MAG: hypothetical protein JNM13_09460 [Hyphomicrobiaceae bacterium]|nr:hypothetical protein [Hyphomicrobiaceae bacterium]
MVAGHGAAPPANEKSEFALMARPSFPAVLLIAALSIAAGAARPARAEEPYLSISGGGFVFNYRVAAAYLSVALKPERPFPRGSRIEIRFENPAGGAPLVVTQAFPGGTKTLVVQSGDMSGIRAGVPYRVEVRLTRPGETEAFAETARSFVSDLDQSVLPEKPQFIGNGYHRNPELDHPDAKVVVRGNDGSVEPPPAPAPAQ